MKKKEKSKANSRQEKCIANSRQDKSRTNSTQQKNKEIRKKTDHEESMKQSEDLHIQHKVNEEFAKNTSKTRTGSSRTERR